MGIKNISVAIAMLAGTAGVTNSGIGIYRQVVLIPERNEKYNRSLLTETPVVVETVEILPDPSMAMKVEVTIKVYRTGDIMVESGTKRQFIPFRLTHSGKAAGGFVATAFAAEDTTTMIDGVEYDVQTVKYIENAKILPEDRMERTRKFADGTMEISIINIRSNSVVDTRTEKVNLTDAERQAIEKSPYKKKVFQKKGS